ncbi:uncharacterized protein [Dysidea avara]
MQSEQRLHVKIYDMNKPRWEIPPEVSPPGSLPSFSPNKPLYNYTTAKRGEYFYFAVNRVSDGEVLFNTSFIDQPLEFADQFLSIATTLPGNEVLYGLGERKASLALEKGKTYTLWSFDSSFDPGVNLYGSHPFYMDLRQSGKAHGVYLRNSNGMDVVYGDNFLTYRVIGGLLDFYFFLGPTPELVLQQYQEVIGAPRLPPYWALGFHQCRYGYHSVEALYEVITNFTTNKIPLDGIWSDIDYMNEYRDFTLDPNNYPKDKMDEFVRYVHNNSMYYVLIIDPTVKVELGYKPYDDGVDNGVFIKNQFNEDFTGRGWPGGVVYPDFFNDATTQYWNKQISDFYHTQVKMDGIWLDRNEISNFCNGQCSTVSHKKWLSLVKKLQFDPVDPPYHINNQGIHAALNIRTLDMNALHSGNITEYNTHNLFGLTESISTITTLDTLRGKRSLLVSRSTFPASGVYGGHWTGYNHATFDDLRYSIPAMLGVQISSGVTLVGADICGYFGDTSEELCSRWIEVGAFYPLARNQNDKNSKPQEPYMWPSVAAISRKVLSLRYSLLPYYYTLFFKANTPLYPGPAATITRPLFFEFPSDVRTHYIDQQFMVGSGLLVSPVLEEGATKVDAYFPRGRWYDIYTNNLTVSSSEGATVTLSAPIDHIPVHVRGGSVIPGKGAAMTTTETLHTSSTLLVALDDDGSAFGDLYIDDGESIDPKQFCFIQFTVISENDTGQLAAVVIDSAGEPQKIPPLDAVTVLGVQGTPSKAYLNDDIISHFLFNTSNHVMLLSDVNADLTDNFKITWD